MWYHSTYSLQRIITWKSLPQFSKLWINLFGISVLVSIKIGNLSSSHLTNEEVELDTIALLLVIVFTLFDVDLSVSLISFTALLEEVDVACRVSDDVFSLLNELLPAFCTIFIWLIEATELLFSLLLLSVEVLLTAENCNGKTCWLDVGLSKSSAAPEQSEDIRYCRESKVRLQPAPPRLLHSSYPRGYAHCPTSPSQPV